MLTDEKIVSLYKVGYAVELPKQKDTLEILSDCTYTVKTGEFHLVTGPSGSGKTTLLQLIATILPVSSGDCVIFGKRIDSSTQKSDLSFVRSKIGYLFQVPYFPAGIRVGEYLEIQALLSGIGTSTAQERVAKLLADLNVANLTNSFPQKLSGGEKQRLALISVLAKDVDLLLLDEPAGSLDADNKELFLDMLESIRKDFPLTIVMVSHDESISEIADRTFVLENKRLGQLG